MGMPPPDLGTERLLLRQWRDGDEPELFEIYGDGDVTRWLGMEPLAALGAVAAHRAFIAGRVARYPDGLGGWGIAARHTGRLVGGALLKPLPDADDHPTEHIEVGWHLARSAWGHGYATEAAGAVLRYAFDVVGLSEVHAVVRTGNRPSERVAERLGMEHRGTTDAWYGTRLTWFTTRRDGQHDRSLG